MVDVTHLIEIGGLLILALIIFAESGMFVGFFFPGDTLLVTAGIFSAQGKLPEVGIVIAVIAFAAILGDNIGYQIGRRYGRRLFSKKDSLIFRQEYAHKAEIFFDRYGAKTMLMAHFIPVVRTFAPPVAGVANMDYKKYFIYDAIGDTFWATSVTLVGYWFGTKIPNIDKYAEIAILTVVAITLGPTIYHLAQAMRKKRKAAKQTTHVR